MLYKPTAKTHDNCRILDDQRKEHIWVIDSRAGHPKLILASNNQLAPYSTLHDIRHRTITHKAKFLILCYSCSRWTSPPKQPSVNLTVTLRVQLFDKVNGQGICQTATWLPSLIREIWWPDSLSLHRGPCMYLYLLPLHALVIMSYDSLALHPGLATRFTQGGWDVFFSKLILCMIVIRFKRIIIINVNRKHQS